MTCETLTKTSGKVRDIYDEGDTLLIETSDRLSAFDRHVTNIPRKGEVLNKLSAWWFEQTHHIVPNHYIEMPEANSMRVKKCKPFPIEMIVRGYIAGSTQTSLWTLYKKGQRDFGDFILPDGLMKHEKLNRPVITPTTKSEDHDRPITTKEIVAEGLLSAQEWDMITHMALELFEFGSQVAAQKGFILVDTKYEFGVDENGNILLIDEVHTPDSSRYWDLATYQELFENNQTPKQFDKEIIRRWLKQQCDPYDAIVLPDIPEDLIQQVSQQYINIYERLTGNKL